MLESNKVSVCCGVVWVHQALLRSCYNHCGELTLLALIAFKCAWRRRLPHHPVTCCSGVIFSRGSCLSRKKQTHGLTYSFNISSSSSFPTCALKIFFLTMKTRFDAHHVRHIPNKIQQAWIINTYKYFNLLLINPQIKYRGKRIVILWSYYCSFT